MTLKWVAHTEARTLTPLITKNNRSVYKPQKKKEKETTPPTKQQFSFPRIYLSSSEQNLNILIVLQHVQGIHQNILLSLSVSYHDWHETVGREWRWKWWLFTSSRAETVYMNDDILIRLSKQMHEPGKSIQNQGNKYPATTGMYLLLHLEEYIFAFGS